MLIKTNRDGDAFHDESEIDHDTLNNVHQDVNTTADPTFTGLNFSVVGSLPGTVTVGKVIRLTTDDRLYYGKVTI